MNESTWILELSRGPTPYALISRRESVLAAYTALLAISTTRAQAAAEASPSSLTAATPT